MHRDSRAYFESGELGGGGRGGGAGYKRAPEALTCRDLEMFVRLLFYVFFAKAP